MSRGQVPRTCTRSSPENSSPRWSHEVAALEDLLTAKESRFDDAGERAPEIRGQTVSGESRFGTHLEGSLRIPHDEIRGGAGNDRAFASREPGEPRRRFAHPRGEAFDRVAAFARLRPHRGKPELER